ncbi:MAG TPA: response regulator [Terriglobales bacterium]|nr:response regulator [Terriglobales bacterium]
MKGKRTILCVDSNEQALSIRKVILETHGYRVQTATNGAAAVRLFQAGGVDLVLADLTLTDTDGARLIEQIKGLSPHTPAILFSNRVRIYERETCADVFLPKGAYSPAEVLERIRHLLARKRGPRRIGATHMLAGATRVGVA